MGVKLGSLALLEEHKLSVSENTVLGEILGYTREKETGHRTRLHNKKSDDLLFVNKYHRSIQSGRCKILRRNRRCHEYICLKEIGVPGYGMPSSASELIPVEGRRVYGRSFLG